MTEAEKIRHKLDMINKNSIYGLYSANSSEIAKIVHSYLERGISTVYDRFNSPPPPIYIDPVKIKSLKERLEEMKMKKATSTQEIKNVKDIIFSIENYPIEKESKLTIVAMTDDDIFEFKFEGEDLLQSCKKSGLFTGWEKDQEIREKNREINKLNKQLQEAIHDKKRLEYKLKELTGKYTFLDGVYNGLLKDYHQLKDKLDLERGANEAQHKFFRQYAGDGVEVDFNYAIESGEEVSYVIVDKEKYQSLKNAAKECDHIMFNGFSYTSSDIERLLIGIRQLEELKTPTIENFADEQPSTRSDILDRAKKCVCGQREQDYGSPESNFQLIADLWNGYLFPSLKENKAVISAKDVAMLMALMKIARIRNGGGSGDSFVDLAGYAACGGEIWAEVQKQKDQN